MKYGNTVAKYLMTSGSWGFDPLWDGPFGFVCESKSSLDETAEPLRRS